MSLDQDAPVIDDAATDDTTDMERQLLATALSGTATLQGDALALSPEEFGGQRHAALWRMVTDRAGAGEPTDAATMAAAARDSALPSHQRATLTELAFELADAPTAPTGASVSTLVDEIRRGHVVRATRTTMMRAQALLADGKIGRARELLTDLDPGDGQTSTWKTLRAGWDQARADAERGDTVQPTPWTTLNRRCLQGGFKSGEVYILGGATGGGKTATAQQVVATAVHAGTVPAVFSVEMSLSDLARRMASTVSGVGMSEVMRPGLDMSAEAWQAINTAMDNIGDQVLVDDDQDLTISRLRDRARVAVRRHGAGLIVVDYAQIVDCDDPRADERTEIKQVLQGLKRVARELRVPVFVLAQPNREASRTGRYIGLSDLHGSGEIEKTAAAVFLLNPEKQRTEEGGWESTGRLLLDVAKNRYGPLDRIALLPDLAHQTFVEDVL